MMYKKVEKRISQYLTFFDRIKYTFLININDWESCTTSEIFRRPPDEQILPWDAVPRFPLHYGKDGETWWFRTSLQLPESCIDREIFIELETQTDTLIFINDIPVGAVNPFHGKFRLTPYNTSENPLKIHFEVWAGHTFPGYHPFDGPRVLTTVAHRQESYPLILQQPKLLVKNNEIYNFYYDVLTLYETAKIQDDNSLLKSQILKQLHSVLIQIDITADYETLLFQVKDAGELLKPLLKLKNGTMAPKLYSTGNAHLDHAWLWPISETSRKCARTCANMAAFTEEYPEFHFLFSQPVQMLELKNNYPEIFRRVKDSVKRGQWEPNGGMWVEADCNLTSGESIIRQFIYGHRTTDQLFGYRGNTLWLPDVFGYSGSLPQIMKGCGIEYFVTSKISWNDTSRFPYDLFNWKGIDGTSIKTHFITTAYEGRNEPSEASEAWNKIQHKDIQSSIMRSIGEGDGGGGTLRSDLEFMRRMEDLQGLPKNKWTSLSDAMDNIFTESRDLPDYSGELYLELHRGTYTNQAQIKRYNRKLEYALRDIELKEVRLLLMNTEEGRQAAEDGHQVIDKCWKELLTLQFHDILPGTSVRQVNVEALQTYGKIENELNSISNKFSKVLYSIEEGIVLENTLPFSRTAIINMPHNSFFHSYTESFQETRNLSNEPIFLSVVEIEGLKTCSIKNSLIRPLENNTPFVIEENNVETPFYYIRFDNSGGISEMIFKDSKRKVSVDGFAMNSFFMVEDFPANWDAWDIEDDYRFKEKRNGKLLSQEVISTGNICLQIRQKLSIGKSSILTQDIFFYAHTQRIDFQTHVDWQEQHCLLRVNFPTSVISDKGYFDIPFGFAEREIHRNRPDNRAQFEVCAHKWAMIKDNRLSTALLSDCKYGYRVESGLLSLTLLRSSTAPDPLSDRGQHHFTYSFFSSETDDIRDIIREGWDLNIPVEVTKGSLAVKQSEALFSFSSEDVMVESIKISEDREGVILRICEMTGAPLELIIKPNYRFNFDKVIATNMLEEKINTDLFDAVNTEISMHGFEVKTLKYIFN